MTWKPGPNVQRTAPPESSRNTIAARFESFRRSHSLRIQVAPQETQVSVEPLYMLQVEPNRVRLTATLKYKVRGTPAYGVNIQLPNWRVEQIGPDALVDADALDREKREPLQIPLRAAAVPESGEFTLQLDAIQEIAEGSGAVSITLPRPEAKASTRAVVVVLPADNVELTIADSELQGLEKEPFPPQIELPVRQQTPLFFRERSDVKSAVLGAALRLRARAVSVASHIRLQVEGPRLHVRQQLDYRVAYEPLRALELLVPRAVLDSGTLKILHADQALPFNEVTAAGGPGEPTQAAAAGDRSARVQVDLLADRIGPLDVLLQYDLPAPAPGMTGTSPAQILVAVPVADADTVLTTSRLDIDAGLDAQVQLPSRGLGKGRAVRTAGGPRNLPLPFFPVRRGPADHATGSAAEDVDGGAPGLAADVARLRPPPGPGRVSGADRRGPDPGASRGRRSNRARHAGRAAGPAGEERIRFDGHCACRGAPRRKSTSWRSGSPCRGGSHPSAAPRCRRP